ncbi:MAG TPA: pirin family protein, partial [Candidatus Kapabacteria bacterium]|nr:pirin family protein [Candidatus Kapabacteria bacterium]
QIWVVPNKRNVAPRYDQITLQDNDRQNVLQQILSPSSDDAGVWVHQDAWFHLGTFDKGKNTVYQLKKQGNGVYAFLLHGEARIAGQMLGKRDGFGIWDIDSITIESLDSGTEILLMEVPMNV